MKWVHDQPGSLEKMMSGWVGPRPDFILIHSSRISAIDALIAASLQLQGGTVMDLDLLPYPDAEADGVSTRRAGEEELLPRLGEDVPVQPVFDHGSTGITNKNGDKGRGEEQEPERNRTEESGPSRKGMDEAEPVMFGLSAPFICPSCRFVAPNAAVYRLHMRKKHGAVKYICVLHDKVYPFLSRLKIHIKIHHADLQTKFWCDSCNKSFHRKWELNIHMLAHIGTKHKCPVCQAGFLSYAVMASHKNSSHTRIRHKCRDCDADFATKGNLGRHVNDKHQGMKYGCPSCEENFTTKQGLNAHRDAIHEQSQFDCGICGFKASYQLHLRSHQLTVHQEETVDCDFCDESFRSNSHLKIHVEGVHLLPTHSCQISGCGRIHYWKQSLLRHLHDFHRPVKFDCQLCPIVCDDKFNYRRHLHAVHGISAS